MKKIICLILVTGCTHNAAAMDGGFSPRQGADRQASQEQPAQESGFGFFAFAGNMQTLFTNTLDRLDQAFGAGADQPEAKPHVENAHTNLLHTELATKNLAQVILDASRQDDTKTFISLLIGMRHLEMRPNPDTQVVITQRLNLLQLERRQVTKDMLEKRMALEREVHTLRKLYALENEKLSDNEDYTDSARFVNKVLNDE